MSGSNSPTVGALKRSTRKEDVRTLHELLPELDDEGIAAVYFRFWENMTIQQIAQALGKSWAETDWLIDSSIEQLRDGFTQKRMLRSQIAA